MTEDTSPENLRKFLESDDPALVRMGLSMAKGAGVPDDLLEEILWMYMFHDDKTIRAAAKSTFIKLAPEDAKQAVKENWKASYRTGRYGQLGILGKALCQTSVSLVGQLIKSLRDKDQGVRRDAAHALGVIGDARAVEPLIKALGDEVEVDVRRVDTEVLGEIGEPAVEPLIKALEDDEGNVRYDVANVLGKIADARAVEPLIKALKDEEAQVRVGAAMALGEIGDARAVEPLIKTLEDKENYVRGDAAGALGKITDARAVEPLIKALDDDDEYVRGNAAEALGKIGDERAVEPLIKMLSTTIIKKLAWKDGSLVRIRIGDGRAEAAADALKKLGHEVEV
jgi:hypothetical protein